MLKIYHNPRCRKSREAVDLLDTTHVEYEVVLYLKTPPTPEELHKILSLLNMSPINLVRKQESIWKEEYKGREWTDDQLVQILCDNPKLIERPIIFDEQVAVVGRPLENLTALLNQLS